jgi:SP family myo-inositol transporter-like MFS transporter 13
MYYSATLLVQAGFAVSEAIWLAAALALVNVLGTVAAGLLIERSGRRPLMVASAAGAAVALVAAAVAFMRRDAQSPEVHASLPPCGGWRLCAYCVTDDRCGFAARDHAVAALHGSAASAFRGWAEWGACVPGTAAGPAAGNVSGLLPGVPTSPLIQWHFSDCPAKSLQVAQSGVSTLGLGWWVFGSTIAYLVAFAPGLGTVPWTLQAELFPTSARAAGDALATAPNWATNLVISAFFLTLISVLSAYAAFFMVAAVAAFSCWYFAVALPETRGVRLEDMHELLAQE